MKNIIAYLLTTVLTYSIGCSQNNLIKFNEILTFNNKSDLPADVFTYLQKKGLQFAGKDNFADLIDNSSLQDCNKYFYTNKELSVTIDFCKELKPIPTTEYRFMLTFGFVASYNYEYLTKQIATICKLQKIEQTSFNDVPFKSYNYQYNNSIDFVYYKYFSKRDRMEYFVMMNIK